VPSEFCNADNQNIEGEVGAESILWGKRGHASSIEDGKRLVPSSTKRENEEERGKKRASRERSMRGRPIQHHLDWKNARLLREPLMREIEEGCQ